MAEVLIVDDDEDTLEVLAELVAMDGHHVRLAHDGVEGLRTLECGGVDLILLDIEMPQLTGPEMAYQLLVRDAGMDKIPIVLLSGNVGLRSVARAVGTPYFLAKPYSAEKLFALSQRALTEKAAPHPDLPVPPAGY